MDAIAKIESEHKDPHDTSFCPMSRESHAQNGSITPSRAELDVANPSRTNSAFSSLFKRATNGPQSEKNKAPCKEKDIIPIHGERYLPCHYFDYISGTSTGG